VPRADDGEVAAVKSCDPARAAALGYGNYRCVRSSESQVSVSRDEILDAVPVINVEVGYFYLALDD
jgi:hypothetical protein